MRPLKLRLFRFTFILMLALPATMLLALPALAQGPMLTGTDPTTNTVDAPIDSSVALADTLPSEVDFATWSTQTGAAVDGNAVTWSSANDAGTAQAGSAEAAYYTAASTLSPSGSGNWDDVFPPCTEVVCDYVIPTGVTVTLNQNINLAGNLTVEPGGTLLPNSKTVTLTGDTAQTLIGNPLTFYNLVVNKTVNDPMLVVTIDGKLTVTKKLTVRSGKLVSASDYEDIEIEHDGELELTSDITVSGSFTHSGTLVTNGYGITFDGAKTQNLYVEDYLSFVGLTVYTGTVLVEANPNGTIILDGALINYGVIRETQPVTAAGVHYFGLVGTYSGSIGMEIDITDRSGGDPLTAIQVDRNDGNHPNAPGSATTDIYWTITPSGTDYVATVVLPQNALADPLACRYSGGAWDCGRTSFDSDIDLTVTRAGVTAFSDWAVFETQATTTTLATSASPVTQRAVITFTATIAPAAAPGSVEFFADGASLGTVTVTAGSALLPTADLSAGSHTITATYSGGANYSASTATPITQVVHAGVTAINDAAGTLQATPVTIAVLANDHDPAGQGLTVITVTSGAHGGVAIAPDGQTVTYTPAANFTGLDSFTYTAADGHGATDDAVVAVVVTAKSQTDNPPQVVDANPAISHTLTFSATRIDIALDLPAGFYTSTVEGNDIFFLAFTPDVTPTHTTPPSGLKFGDANFTVDAFLNDTSLGGVTFATPVTLTLTYSPTQFSGVGLDTLCLYAWNKDGGFWSDDGITCPPPDTGNHTLTCGIGHLTEFALFGKDASLYYLPLIFKNFTSAPDLARTELSASGGKTSR